MEQVYQSPLMRQYNSIKAKYPDAILFFRCGDYYEIWSDDATKTAKTLGLKATQRNGEAQIAIKYCDLDKYLPRLVRDGHRVAICEQLDAPDKVNKPQTPKQLALW